MSDVDDYLAALDPGTASLLRALRDIILAAAPGLVESINWNAPSYADGDEDRITLGVERKGGVRLVLHRGAQKRDTTGFAFADPARLAKWPAADRGVASFATPGAIQSRRDEIADLCARWIAHCRS